jgi:hypothetical protein
MRNFCTRAALVIALAWGVMAPSLLAGDLEFEASTAILSHYMWRGIRLAEGGVLQPSFTTSYKGLSANVWGNYSFAGGNNSNEVDFTASYAREKDKLNFEAGFIHYGVLKGGVDSDEIYTSIGHNNFLNPSLKAYFDVNYGKGAFLQVALEPSIPLGKEASLNFKTNVGYVIKNSYMGVNDAGNEFSNLYNAEFIMSLTLPLGKGFSFEPMVGYTTGLSSNAQQAIRNSSVAFQSDTIYGGGTLTFSF